MILRTHTLDRDIPGCHILYWLPLKTVANRPRTREDLSARVIGGEVVVLDRHGGKVHQLNSTASYVWDRCDGRLTEAEIADDLSEAFEVEPNQAVSDVGALIGQFRELGLLESST